MMQHIPAEKIRKELMKMTATKLEIPLEIVEAVVDHQFKELLEQMSYNSTSSTEISGFGRFYLTIGKIEKRMAKLMEKEQALEYALHSGKLTELGTKRYTYQLNSIRGNIEVLKSKFMKIDFKGIMEGVWNSVFVKNNIEVISRERLAVCKGCSFNSDHQKTFNNYKTFRPDFHCTDCGCNLQTKTRALSQSCPKGKWLAQITEDEEGEINRKLYEDQQNKQNPNKGVDQPAEQHG